MVDTRVGAQASAAMNFFVRTGCGAQTISTFLKSSVMKRPSSRRRALSFDSFSGLLAHRSSFEISIRNLMGASLSFFARLFFAGTSVASSSVSSSSSSPNDSLPLAAVLRFFLNTGLGVDALYLANKHAQYRLEGPRTVPFKRCASTRAQSRASKLLELHGLCASLPVVIEIHETDSLRFEVVLSSGCL